MEVDIGNRLRALRISRKLSQRELARRAGLRNSTISLVESGRSNPTIGALKRILDGIPIGLAEFFAFEPKLPREFFFEASQLTEIGKGRIASARAISVSISSRPSSIWSSSRRSERRPKELRCSSLTI